MAVENHPSIDQLRDQLNEEWVKEHVATCERCSAVVEGLQLLKEESQVQNQPLDQLLNNSRQQSWNIIEQKIPRPQKSNRMWYGSVTVAFVVMVGVWFIYFQEPSEESPELNSPYPAPAFRSTLTPNASAFVVHYQEGNYELARGELEKGDRNGENQFYTGLTYLYQSAANPDSALYYLKSQQVKKSLYAQNAEYYSAIAHLMLYDTTSALLKLNAIISDKYHSNLIEAEELVLTLQQ